MTPCGTANTLAWRGEDAVDGRKTASRRFGESLATGGGDGAGGVRGRAGLASEQGEACRSSLQSRFACNNSLCHTLMTSRADPETEHKGISHKVVATVVSSSSFANPCDGRCSCRLQYPLKIAERAHHAIKIPNFQLMLQTDDQLLRAYQGLDCRYGE